MLVVMGEVVVRSTVAFPPTTFFVEEMRENVVWVRDNPYYGYTFFHPGQARLPAQNLFLREKNEATQRILVLGESAAMGFPHPEFGLARMLAAHLGTQYPGLELDVIDGTMTMINSHLLREITLEAIEYQPDLILIYAGNNEVIGPYGAAGVFGGFRASTAMVRMDRWLRTRSALFRWLTASQASWWRSGVPPQWKGLDHFVDSPVRFTDSRVKRTYAHFRRNMADLAEVAGRQGIPVVFVTPAVNLSDWPPLHSFLPESFSYHDRQRWEAHVSEARRASQENELPVALAAWRAALMLVPGHAETAYQLAAALVAMDEHDEAMHWFEQACLWDGYRFRADKQIAEIVSAIALQDPSRTLVDVRPLLSFGQSSFDPVWLEHVHFSVSGMTSLVAEIAPVVSRLLDLSSSGTNPPDPLRGLNMQPDIVQASWSAVGQFLKMRVFREQEGYSARLEDIARRIHAAARQVAAVGVGDIQAAHQDALDLAVAPSWLLHTLQADYLERRQAIPEAIAAISSASSLMPHNASLHQTWGRLLFLNGDLNEAISAFEKALDLNPYLPESLNHLGLIWQHRGARERARAYYEQTLALDSNHAGALNNLGYLEYEQGRGVQAVDLFRRALTVNPALTEARYHLGLVLMGLRDLDEASLQLEEVVRQRPRLGRAWSAWGVVAMQQGLPMEAERRFTRALREDPGLLEAKVNLAYVWLELDQPGRAVPALADVLKYRPDAAEVHYLYGKALIGAGDLSLGLDHLRRAVQAASHRTDWMLEAAGILSAHLDADPEYSRHAEELARRVLLISGGVETQAVQILKRLGVSD
ncbi:MAG TPA: tetratricopeptide repeat protein [Kiritimatiellia bacterium]|nr:tetratricopeptide repeat protein [Kiritimatiellia bacterium]